MKKLLATLALLLVSGVAQAFEHDAWDALLKRHVVLVTEGNASLVDYAGMLSDRAALKRYLDTLSAATGDEYRRWPKGERLAFLINAYNAFTVELILSEYPDVESIKNLGGLFQSPWKKQFFTLLGEDRDLDNLEHELIRAPGAFDEPRIHFAVNCASLGCPMLRNEAYTAERLDTQLEDGMHRFLSDRSRTRFDTASGTLRVSKIFDWYGNDFEQGHYGFTSLKATFAKYADRLADGPEARLRVLAGDYRIDFLDYDWRLNDA
jgi:hypothetical protein